MAESDIVIFPEGDRISLTELSAEDGMKAFGEYAYLLIKSDDQTVVAATKDPNGQKALIDAAQEKLGNLRGHAVCLGRRQLGEALDELNRQDDSDVVFFPENAAPISTLNAEQFKAEYGDYHYLMVKISDPLQVPLAGIKTGDQEKLGQVFQKICGLDDDKITDYMTRPGGKLDLGEGVSRPSKSYPEKIAEQKAQEDKKQGRGGV